MSRVSTPANTNWPRRKIGDLAADVRYGSSSKTSEDSSGVPVLRMGNIQNGTLDLEKLKYLPVDHDEFPRLLLEPGDVLFNRTNSAELVGKTAVYRGNPKKCSYASYLIALRLSEGIPEWVSYYLNSSFGRKWIKSVVSQQVGQANVNGSKLKDFEIPFPPVAEQRRIVARIEELFSRLDAGVAALRHAKAQLQRYRQSVLAAAVTGQLTQAWREQHPATEPAEELLERILEQRRKQWDGRGEYKEPPPPVTSASTKIPRTWARCTIGQIAECLDRLRVPVNKKDRVARVGSIPYYGANGQVGWIDDYIFDEDLILVVEDETFTGRKIPFSYRITGKTWVNNHAHVLRNTGAVAIGYLNYALMFYPFTALTTGTTGRKKLTQNAMVNAPLLLPPLAEQHQIVAEVEARTTAIDHLEAELDRQITRSNRLRQSTLAAAFSGNLNQPLQNDGL
jgi:type I restriction enzyme S subunit